MMARMNVSGESTLLGNATMMARMNVSGETTLLGNTTMVSQLNVSGMTLISRIIGFMRDMVMARYFGAGFASDAFLILKS
jgi:hypothetical protein